MVRLWFTSDRLGRIGEVVGMVVTVDAIQRLDAHAEEARRPPHGDPVLHQPGRRSMAQRVRRDLARKPRQPNRRFERGLHRGDGRAVPLDEMLLDDPFRVPAPHVGQEPRRDRRPLIRSSVQHRRW